MEQGELNILKDRAKLLGIKHHPSIGLAKLQDKVDAYTAKENLGTGEQLVETLQTVAEQPQEPVAELAPIQQKVLAEAPRRAAKPATANQIRAKLHKDASRLIRIRVTCMNPNKKEWAGEIITVGNSAIGSFKKYIPFNAENGWHVPVIIYKALLEKQCQVFYTVKGPRGEKIRKGKLIKEMSIEVLSPLTGEEMNDLATQQAMANNLD